MTRECIAWLVVFGISVVPAASKSNVYIADFTTRDLQKTSLTTKFTHEFEQFLVQADCFNVLERSKYSRVLTEKDRERAINDIAQFSESALANLQTEQAEMVVFGEIFDDVESGHVSVSATLQKFDSDKVLIDAILLSRGKVKDAESRHGAMNSLAWKICRYTIDPEARISTMNETTTRFTKRDDGTIIDLLTGLMWADKDNARNVRSKAARSYCENSTLGGYSDWRWPSILELREIYDPDSTGKHKIAAGIKLTSKYGNVWSNSGEIFSFIDKLIVPPYLAKRVLCVREIPR